VRALGVVGEGLIELGVEPAPDDSVTLGFGGDAPNAAVMAALLGVSARIAGRVGDDALGRRLLAFWRSAGVDVGHVVVDPDAPTGIYVNERGAEGLQRFDYHRAGSAGSRLAPADLGPAFLDGLGVLHVTGITLAVSPSSSDAALAAVERARAAGSRISVAVNHRPALRGDPARILELATRAHVVFVSEDEAGAVFGASEPSVVGAALPGVEELVVTRGADGCLVRHAGTETARPAFAVEVVDAAGAGDALAGAYLASRLAGADPEAALEMGAVAAALSCRARGCARSYPGRAEVEAACGALPGHAREDRPGGGR
jgi:2-dehydro-3-deoxygluconokinase